MKLFANILAASASFSCFANASSDTYLQEEHQEPSSSRLRGGMAPTANKKRLLQESNTTAPTPVPTNNPTSHPTDSPTTAPTIDPGFDLDILRPHLSNIALSKTAAQSSTCYGGVPLRGIDNNTDGNWRGGSVTHTCWEMEPWWEVDLATATGKDVSLAETQETSRIFGVTFTNRLDGFPRYTDRISYGKIEVLNVYGHVVASRYLGDMYGVAERTVNFGIPSGGNRYDTAVADGGTYHDNEGGSASGVEGTYVRISRRTWRSVVTIAELQVWGATLCPSTGLTRDLPSGGGEVTLAKVGTIGRLCTLAKVTRRTDQVTGENKIESIIPLARSYDNQDWSNAAGEVAALMLKDGWDCFNADGDDEENSYCKTYLPALELETEAYVLTTYDHTLSRKDQVSRFLSQATFGVTRDDLNDPLWVGSQGHNDTNTDLPALYANWIQDQMNAPTSSHREFYRKRANAPVPGSFYMGPVADPCTTPSRWRKVSLGIKEWEGKTLEPFPNSTLYKVMVGGQLRSFVDESNKGVNNPEVSFTGWEELLNGDITKMPYVLDLPEIGVEGDLDKMTPYDGPSGSGYLLRTPVGNIDSSNGGLCDPSSNPMGLPRLEASTEYGAIVGRLSDGQWLLYDGTLELRDNEVTSPLADGGGRVAKHTAADCANAPRTFLNSAGCRLSTDQDVCREDTLVAGGTAHASGSDGILVCGSPGEVSNDVSYKHGDSFYLNPDEVRLTNRLWIENVAREVWSHLSIAANDQLRQRTAFVLNQIFAVVKTSVAFGPSEVFVNYHDIFIRNAFGNWKDILREVAYSPMMAKNLSYLQSKSMAFVKETINQLSFADENFAREIMQLFNIGTHLLNEDGTLQRDPETGNDIEAYSTLDIMSFARAWTGFDMQKDRGNIEKSYNNDIDPMQIVPEWRDKFPKTNLAGGYIGDSYPLCEDLPLQAFLSKGSRYRFIGGSKLPELMKAKQKYLTDETMVELELDSTSQLRATLCNGAGIDCQSQPPSNEVVLPLTLECAAGTKECEVETVRVIKVAEGRYWEYVRQPCVELAFFDDGKEVGSQFRKQAGQATAACANPRLPIASEACCGLSLYDGTPCNDCDDGNVCTMDLCTEGGCNHEQIAGCENGATMEYWYGMDYSSGVSMSALKNDSRFPDHPDKVVVLDNTLEAYRDGDRYGARIKTYLSVPKTGSYTFYIRGDDLVELWLHSNSGSTAFGNGPIAYTTRWTSSFDTFASQKSAPIDLEEGEWYILEAYLIENGGGDGIAIGWESSDAGILREVIPASRTRQRFINGPAARMLSLFDDERVSYSRAAERCVAQGGYKCDYAIIDAPAHKTGYHWTNNTCDTFIKVTSDETTPGWIAIVHNTNSDVLQHVDKSSTNYFSVIWNQGFYPKVDDNCGGASSSCEVVEEGCYCPINVSESVGYDSMPPSVEDVQNTLFIGAADPAATGSVYETETDPATGIVAYKKVAESGAVLDTDTVFEVLDERTGRSFFLRNVISTVSVDSGHSFRNAPHFMSFLPSETDVRDAQYETEAVLDDYLFHKNTAPFLARLFIQRFNIHSNPAPAYVSAVANAFRTGQYSIEGKTFGSAKYGDLASTIAAIFLSPEAFSPTVDADPASGSIRQPLLKVIALLRNLELGGYTDDTIYRIGRALKGGLGQSPYDYDTVFSHFTADSPSNGRGSDAEFYSPEQMALDLPRILSILNGSYGTVNSYGFNSRYGFGSGWSGLLNYAIEAGASAEQAVSEISTLLTAGRLSKDSKDIIEQVYTQKALSSGLNEAKKLALQLILSTPEYHTTNIVTKSGEDRVLPSPDVDTPIAIVDNNCAEPSSDPLQGEALVEIWDGIISDSIQSFIDSPNYPDSPTVTTTVKQINGNSDLFDFPRQPRDRFGMRMKAYITAPVSGNYTFWVSADDDADLYLSTDTCEGSKRRIAYQGSWSAPHQFDKFVSQKSEPIYLVEGSSYYMEGYWVDGGGADHFTVAWAIPGNASVPDILQAQYFSMHPPKPQFTPAPAPLTEAPSEAPSETPPPDYKAIIYLDLNGGVDSYNMLVPQQCEGSQDPKQNKTVDEQYYLIRSRIALSRQQLHQIDSGNENQPCTMFGLHPQLSNLANFYRQNKALFFANIGYLTQPDWTKTKGITFSHSAQSKKVAEVDAFREYGDSGVLGRLRDTLIKSGHTTSAISVYSPRVLEGERGHSSGPVAVGLEGVSEFPKWVSDPDFLSHVGYLNNATEPDSGFMAEAWSDSLHKTISIMDELSILDGVSATTVFPSENVLGDQLKLVSRLQQTALQRGVTRDLYSVGYGSWDHHRGVLEPQQTMFQQVDDALAAYVAEAKAIGVWDSTVIVQVSEFGRTLYPNGNDGSDHGWGGHYFALGGGLNGGKVLGKYPENLWEVMKAWGRRPVPTLPWDSVWNGVAEWAGARNEDLTKVCPNRGSFLESDLFDAATLFGIHGVTTEQ